jgi:pantoate--beta-alanine ligase
MLRIEERAALHKPLQAWRAAGERIALVPTMGNLHAGHLSLVAEARHLADRVVVSLFVNPTQFAAGEGFEHYPRTLYQDCRALSAAGVALVFAPEAFEMYPAESTTQVTVPALDGRLCGATRPDHFTGVATIVTKLLHLVAPDVAIFGEKDYQQLLVIRRLVADLFLPVEIVGAATVRAPDGLALSSRNGYLSPAERATAPRLYTALQAAARAVTTGGADLATIEQETLEALVTAGFRPDYVRVLVRADLREPSPADRELICLAAAWLGGTRLIDNLPAGRPAP